LLDTAPNDTVGVGFTVIEVVAVLADIQPKGLDPRIEYVVNTVGVTVNDVPTISPGVNVYVDAPPGVITTVF
jgi:hypothetical protein